MVMSNKIVASGGLYIRGKEESNYNRAAGKNHHKRIRENISGQKNGENRFKGSPIGVLLRHPRFVCYFVGVSITLSIKPYSFACSADMKLSRSVSLAIRSYG